MDNIWQTDAIWVSVALLCGLLAKRISLPPLIGFLVAGFIINYSGQTDSNLNSILHILSDLGVMLLLFTIGLKIKLKELFKPVIYLTATIHMITITTIMGAVVFLMSYIGVSQFANISFNTALIIGFALSFSSTVFVVKVLEERGELSSYHGMIAIGILVIQDIFAVLFISISKGTPPNLWAIGLPLYLYLVRKILYKLLNDVEHGELLTIFGFFTTFVIGALSFQFFGLKPDLGALVIGMLLAGHERTKELYNRMMEYKDFFLVAFFISIGLSGEITLNALIISSFFILLMSLKGVLFMFIISRFNIRGRTAFLSSVSLTNYSEFGLIIGLVALKMNLINSDWFVALALAMSFSFVISSPLNQYVHPIYDYLKPIIRKLNIQGKEKRIDEAPANLGESNYLVIGMGTFGYPAFNYLSNVKKENVIGIDYSHELIQELQKKQLNVLWGDSTDSVFWESVDFNNINLVLLAMADHNTNVNTINEIKKIKSRTFKIGVIVSYPDEEELMKQLGADYIYNYKEKAGEEFAENFF
jgi:glutathione-regulated potassium-efflux system ancillary protein KefC